MSYQEDFGHQLELNSTLKNGKNMDIVEQDLPYYRFVGMTEEGKLELATNKHKVLGVTLPSVQDYKINSDGSTVKRDKYFKGEFPHVLYEGTCYVETDDTDIVVGDRLMLGTDGMVKKHKSDKDDVTKAYDSIMSIVGIAVDVRKTKSKLKLVKVYLRL